mgnify:CR=1 FL=1
MIKLRSRMITRFNLRSPRNHLRAVVRVDVFPVDGTERQSLVGGLFDDPRPMKDIQTYPEGHTEEGDLS